MNLNRAKTFAIATAASLLVFTGSASAAVLSGGTSQPGKGITLKTRGDGSIKFVEITWKTTCNNGGSASGTTTYRNVDATPQGFRASGTDVQKKKKVTYKFRSSIDADATNAGYKGTFELKLKAIQKGKTFARCKTGKVRWSAS